MDKTSNDCRKCCSEAPPFEVLLEDADGSEWRTVPRDSVSIRGRSVILDLSAMKPSADAATAVRYAWSDYVDCVLENSEGLVTSPFLHPVPPPESSTRNPALRRQGGAAASVPEAANSPPSIRTPPMGFNSWNFYHCNIDENTVRAIADAMVKNGMRDVGYRYVNIDDCWQVQRFDSGEIQADPARFPSGMKALADYVHSRGLLLGVYTARGSLTCQNRPASYMHEEIDARTYCRWGIDYVKVDNCGGSNWPRTNTSWIKFREAFDSCTVDTGRPVVLSVEYCGSVDGCGEWIARTANLWRTTADIETTWSSVVRNIHAQEPMYRIAKPGHFNDPDMLQIGNIGLTVDEQYSHMALWCVAGAPLLVGTDLAHASNATLAILTNPEVTAVNQDLGWRNNEVQGRIIKKTEGRSEVWAKRLADGSRAVLLLNTHDTRSSDVTVAWSDLGLASSATAEVRDLWRKNDVGRFTGAYTAEKLRPHSSAFIRVTPKEEWMTVDQ